MDSIFSDRIADVPKSFVREILKTTQDDSVISFAGGLPNRALFPVEAIKSATIKVLSESGGDALQYSTTEGHVALREWIAKRYLAKQGIMVDADNIIITNGSQQGLDLIGKIVINDGDPMAIEEPGYLGAIQAFSMYRPQFHPIPLNFDGLEIDALKTCIKNHSLKLLYTVPNFQNPSGISHSDANRDATADSIKHTPTLLIEDDPYGELRFSGTPKRSFFKRIPENTILLGSFSKIFAPAFRLGWIVAPHPMLEKLVVAKQAADLHTNYFAQCVLYQYLRDNNIDDHIEKIRLTYSRQRDAMVRALGNYFPPEVKRSEPEGGMFLWAILPEGISARKVFDRAIREKIAFVPGDPFYVNKTDVNTMRLNFSCVDEQTIMIGIEKLGNVLKEFIDGGCMKHIALIIMTAVACACMLSSCDSADSIKVGLNTELTGSVPVVGKSSRNAAFMAVEEINTKGGIAVDGKSLPVKLLVEDNEDKAESAAAIAQKFISSGVVAMIGPNASRNAVPAATVAESNNLIMISPWATNPKLTEGKKYIFRACFTDDFQGIIVAAFVYKKLGLHKAGVLYDATSEYNKGIAEVFRTAFTKDSGSVSAFESYSTGDKDFSAQLSKIKASGAQVIFLPNYYNEVPLQVEQARRQGFTGAIVGSDSWGSEEILKLGKDLMNGLYFTTHYAADMATDNAKKFITEYQAKFGAKPDDVAALTYDAFEMLFQSIKNASSKDPEKVLARLSTLSRFQGITGTMRFSPGSGSPVKSAVVIQIKNNAFTYFDSISPL